MGKNQLRLQLPLPVSYDYHNWFRHKGVEDACNRLALWTVHGGRIWLNSESAAGKTHLLRTISADHPSIALLSIDATQDWMQAGHWLSSGSNDSKSEATG